MQNNKISCLYFFFLGFRIKMVILFQEYVHVFVLSLLYMYQFFFVAHQVHNRFQLWVFSICFFNFHTLIFFIWSLSSLNCNYCSIELAICFNDIRVRVSVISPQSHVKLAAGTSRSSCRPRKDAHASAAIIVCKLLYL